MSTAKTLDGNRVLIFVADEYEDLELWYPKLRLEEAGVHVTVAGPEAGKTYRGKHGYPCVADAAIVYTNTDPAKGEKGITALVVERGTPGFKVGKEEKKLGIHAPACTELSFTDCEVPAENRIGNRAASSTFPSLA